MEEEFSVASVEERILKTIADKPGELGLEECRDIYLQEIFDWTDYWSENWGVDVTNVEAKEFLNTKLIELWKSYAMFEARNKQFKKAVEVFKKATEDPVVGLCAKLFQVYAEYYLEKNKPASAQKVLIEGLCKPLLSTEENNSLWCYLLDFTKKITKVNDLTFEKLYEEIVTAGIELSQTLSFPPGCDTNLLSNITVNRLVPKAAPVVDVVESKTSESSASISVGSNKNESLASALRIEPMVENQVPSILVKNEPSSLPANATTTTSVTSNSSNIPISIRWFEDNTFSKTQTVSAISSSLSTTWTAEQIVLTFQHRPPMIFSSPTQEPIIDGLKNLSAEDNHDLEVFLTTSISNIEQNGHAKNMLDILEGMWYQQALRERHFDAWITMLSHTHKREEFSVASAKYATAEQARMAEQTLYQRQEHTRTLLLTYIHKCLYELLLEQVGILTTLKFPRCTPLFLQQLEQWSVTSRKTALSFLQQKQQLARNNVAAATTLKFQAEDFGVLRQELLRLQKLLGALFSQQRLQFLLAQGRIPAATLLLATQQQPVYSVQATNAAAAAGYESSLQSQLKQNLSGHKRGNITIPTDNNSSNQSNDYVDDTDGDATSPGGSLRRKTKRRRSVSNGSSNVVGGGGMLGNYDGAQVNSYNMPQMTLSDVAREQIYFQQQQQQHQGVLR